MVAHELRHLGAIGGVLVDAKLQAIAELFVGLLVTPSFGNLCKHFQELLDQVLLDDTQDLVLLQGLARDVHELIYGSTAGNTEESTELKLSLNREMLAKVVLPIVRQTLVETCRSSARSPPRSS